MASIDPGRARRAATAPGGEGKGAAVFHFVIATTDLAAILRDLLSGSPGQRVGASIGLSRRVDGTDFLARRLSSSLEEPGPRGAAVFWIAPDAASLDPATVARVLSGEAGEPRVGLALGVGDIEGRARGVVRLHAGSLRPLDALRLIGPGLPCIELGEARQPAMPADLLQPAGLHSRRVGATGAAAFARLQRLSVVLVGAGGTGSVFATTAARMLSRGLLTIVDPDGLKEHNLGAWADPRDPRSGRLVGRRKAEALAEQIRAMPGAPLVHTVAAPLQDWATLPAVKQADVLVTCVDNAASRLAAAFLSVIYLKPLIDVGTGVFLGSGPREHAARMVEQESASRAGNISVMPTFPPALIEGGVRTTGADVRLVLPCDPGAGCLLCAGGVGVLNGGQMDAGPGIRRTRAPFWASRAGSQLTLNTVAAMEACDLLQDLLTGRVDGSRHRQYDRAPGPEWRDAPFEAAPPACPLCRRAGLGDAALDDLPLVQRELAALSSEAPGAANPDYA